MTNLETPQYERYYSNQNVYSPLSVTANKACHYSGKTEQYEHNGFVYFKQGGIQYRYKADIEASLLKAFLTCGNSFEKLKISNQLFILQRQKMFEKKEALARLMYDDYCEAVGGKAFNGDNLPNSEEFFTDESKTKQANAWRKSAETAIDFLGNISS